MDGKRPVCGTCKWFAPFTGVCLNAESQRVADFVDQMEDTCGHWEGFAQFRFEEDNLTKSDIETETAPEPLTEQETGKRGKDRIQHKKPVGRG